MAPKSQQSELTEKEKLVLGYAWECLLTEPKIDWDKLASLGGYTNPRSAQNVLSAAKKKLRSDAADNADDNGHESAASSSKTTPVKKRAPATPKGKKRNIEAANDNDEDEIAMPTPKRVKKTPAKSPGKKGSPIKNEFMKEEKDEEEEETKSVIDAGFMSGNYNNDDYHSDGEV